MLCQHTQHSWVCGSHYHSLCCSLGLDVGDHTCPSVLKWSFNLSISSVCHWVEIDHRLQEGTKGLLVLPLLCISPCVHNCSRFLLPLLLLLLLLLNTCVANCKASQCLTFPCGKGAHLPLDNWVFISCPVVIWPVEKCSMKTHYNAWCDLPSCCSLPINPLSMLIFWNIKWKEHC